AHAAAGAFDFAIVMIHDDDGALNLFHHAAGDDTDDTEMPAVAVRYYNGIIGEGDLFLHELHAFGEDFAFGDAAESIAAFQFFYNDEGFFGIAGGEQTDADLGVAGATGGIQARGYLEADVGGGDVVFQLEVIPQGYDADVGRLSN